MAQDVYSYSKKSGDRSGRADKAFDWKDTKPKFHKFAKEDDFELSIIPHIIKSKNHPMVRADFKVGSEVYMMDFWVHSSVGASKARIICPNQTWGKPCPVCEEQERMSRNKGWDSKEAKDLKAKHRVIYNIVMNSERNGDIELFETSFALFEDELRKIGEAKGKRKGGKIIPYGTLSEGVSILFSTEKATLNKSEYFKFNAFDFEFLNKPLPASFIDDAIDPSEFLIKLTYDEIQAMLDGDEADDEDEDDEDDEPKAKGRGRRDDDEDEAPKKSRRSSEDDEEPKAKRKSRDDDDDAEEPEEPKARRRAAEEDDDEPKKAKRSRDDEDDEPRGRKDRDEDEAPKARRSRDDDDDEAPKKAKSRDDDDEEEDRPRRGGRESASEDSRPRRSRD